MFYIRDYTTAASRCPPSPSPQSAAAVTHVYAIPLRYQTQSFKPGVFLSFRPQRARRLSLVLASARGSPPPPLAVSHA